MHRHGTPETHPEKKDDTYRTLNGAKPVNIAAINELRRHSRSVLVLALYILELLESVTNNTAQHMKSFVSDINNCIIFTLHSLSNAHMGWCDKTWPRHQRATASKDSAIQRRRRERRRRTMEP